MIPSLWFIVPVHGRLDHAAICLRQLRRTCDALKTDGIHASAVVVADETHHRHLPRLGFAAVTRDNQFLGRRFNDGIQLATDPAWNPHPADYVVPCGSDDWVDHRLFLDLPDQNTVVGFRKIAIVREDGLEMVTTTIDYLGGAGIRIIPRRLVEPLAYRPAEEDRPRACDTSILTNLRVHHQQHIRVEHRHLHDRQIVDWKTPVTQLNPFATVTTRRRSGESCDPFTGLAGVYPDEALAEMAAYYETVRAGAKAAA